MYFPSHAGTKLHSIPQISFIEGLTGNVDCQNYQGEWPSQKAVQPAWETARFHFHSVMPSLGNTFAAVIHFATGCSISIERT
jgi:hypothetical protein